MTRDGVGVNSSGDAGLRVGFGFRGIIVEVLILLTFIALQMG